MLDLSHGSCFAEAYFTPSPACNPKYMLPDSGLTCASLHQCCGLPLQGTGTLEGEGASGPLQALGWQSGSQAGPLLQLDDPGFATLVHLAAKGVPTVRPYR